MTDFTDKCVVVTGGAQNIGLVIAQAFAAQGAQVTVADMATPPSPAMANMHYHETDVSDEQSVVALMAELIDRFSRLDILINNAAICLEVALADMSVTDWDKVMAVNVRSVFLMCQRAFPLLCKAPQAAIVNIGSIEGLGANPLHSAYAASKAAVIALSRNIALEYGTYDIRCNTISPGWINTPFNENLLAQYPDRGRAEAEIKFLHPVGRLGLPEDIAGTAIWLASDQAGFINGQNIIVDGGRLTKLPLPNMSN